jgi:hypothetical protein
MSSKRDGGWRSRKLHTFHISCALVTLVGLAAGKWSNISVIYSTFCTTILTLAALYMGANSVIKYFYKDKSEPSPAPEPEPTPAPTPPTKSTGKK